MVEARSITKQVFLLFSVLLVCLGSSLAKAEVLFEGYSRVLLSGVHVGYYVSRYEFDSKKKQFTSTYLLKTGEVAGNITESLKAVCTDKFEPVSYSYTSIAGADTKIIDATFKKSQMTAKVTENGKKSTISLKIGKDAILSSFLAYYFLSQPEGLQPGKKLSYDAIAEEEGKLYKGLAVVESKDQLQGISVFKVLNDYKDAKFISYATEKGEIISTLSPAQSISTELVADQKTAVGNFSLNTTSLKMLFGSAPEGKENIMSKSASQPKLVVPSGKTQGVPGGKGLIIKPAPPTK